MRRTLVQLVNLVVLLLLTVVLPGIQHRVETELIPSLDAELSELETWRPPTVCRSLDVHGDAFDEFALVRREWMPIHDLPPVAWQAVVAAEDRRFFEHAGVDPYGIARAVVVNLRAGSIREGGSTLTQQLVKNTVVGAERSYNRKLREALLALRLEQRMDKMTILELYLNFIFLGSGNYGLEAAAQDYFARSARELDPGQAALLAGLIPAPSAYSPRHDAEVARERRRIVLDAMVEERFVDPLYAQWLKRQPITPPPRVDELRSDTGTAYATEVRREVRRLLGEDLPFQAGLRIYTPYDPDVQAVAEQAVIEAANAVQARQGHPGRQRRLRVDQIKPFLDAAEGLVKVGGEVQLPSPGACFPAVVLGETKVAAGNYQFTWEPASLWKRIRSRDPDLPADVLKRALRYGDVYRVCYRKKDQVYLPDEDWVQGAAVVVENRTGEVVALVGGRAVSLEGFVRASQAQRQPGSSFKPYVYAAALEDGLTQISTVVDAPLALGGWSPRNYGGGYRGQLPMRNAFAYSINTVAVRLILRTGVDKVIDLANRMGIQSKVRKDLTIALGSSEVTPLEHTVAISSFTRMGRAIPPVFVTRLKDVRDREVGRAGEMVDLPGVSVRLPGGPGVQVIRPSTAWQVLDMMRAVVEFGTGARARKAGEDRGGKTGTTSSYADAWFMGFTSTHTIGVWIGTDERFTLGHGETGGRSALPAWLKIAEALPRDPDVVLGPPADVVMVDFHGQWLGISDENVPPELLGWKDPGDDPLPLFPSARPPGCDAPTP
ncbi:MAG TPA: PBP1A family penicillin-binding protein [Myxococcota bacterium]|nr:PBP1A family penicillin-binding protein [Myxococcota bacterium]